jgi:aryl-phospho-beta-D-glucosidase BglC (GH1 family)
MKRSSVIRLAILILAMVSQSCAPDPLVATATPYPDYHPDNPMVHQVGRTIVGVDGKPLRLRGVNLGGWLLWEGWDFSKGFDLTENSIDKSLADLVGQPAVDQFREQMYANFITEADFQAIAEAGFNSVRLPINYRILEDDNNPYVYKDSGWKLIDQALAWGEKYGVYVILDLHAVPGGQSGLPPSNTNLTEALLWSSQDDQARTIALWKAIASRYKDRRIVAGYDLLNEPQLANGNKLVAFYQKLIPAIREEDPYHLIILEGTAFSGDFTMFSGPLSQNQMYGFHMYNWLIDDRQIVLDKIKRISQAQGVPIWAGEFGDNTYDMIGTTVAMYEDPANEVDAGWSFWTWKKVPGTYPALVAVTVPPRWQAVFNWINDPIAYPEPSAADAQAGMSEFIQAVRYGNAKIDPKMLQALTDSWQ